MKISYCPERRLLAKCSLPDLEFQVDPYIGCAHLCHYCYALNNAETDWSSEILTHRRIGEQLDRELEGVPPQTVYMGYETDPYQPCEEECRQTRQVLELLQARGFSASILTKSNLVLRDLDVLQAMPEARVSFSLAFEDEATRELFEANTMPTRVRLEAVKECKGAGLAVSAMICPVIPYVSDPTPLLEAAAPSIDRAWVYGLSFLSDGESNWQNVRAILKDHFPDVYEESAAAIFDREHSFWAGLRQSLSDAYSAREFEFNLRI